MDFIRSANFRKNRDGDIEAGILWEVFLEEMAKIPTNPKGYKNFVIIENFRPSAKGYTHRLFFTTTQDDSLNQLSDDK